MPPDADPGEFGPFGVASDGVDVAARARVASEPAKNERQGERDPYERRLPKNVGLRNGAVPVGKNGRGNLTAAGVNDNAASVDGERPERRDDRRDAQAGSEQRVARAQRCSDRDPNDKDQCQRGVRVLREPKRRNESAPRDDRADGEIDLSPYDEKRLPQSHDADERSGQGDLFEIRGLQESRLAQCDREADGQQRHKQLCFTRRPGRCERRLQAFSPKTIGRP